jgi:hypothetical protein
MHRASTQRPIFYFLDPALSSTITAPPPSTARLTERRPHRWISQLAFGFEYRLAGFQAQSCHV